MAFMLKRLS
jgi:hypothetical protein